MFVILAGMGISLLSGKFGATAQDRLTLRNIILKRALFLFVAGLLLNTWWPADILHMYGCYLAIAASVLFADKRLYLILACVAIVVFHALLMFIPYETAWNFQTFRYGDFYTINGFLRNTFYNGWNPVFPWMAYFFLGMFLGKLNWKETAVQKKVFIAGLITYVTIFIVEVISYPLNLPKGVMAFIHADYLPPMLPFLLSTAGFSLVLVSGFMFIGTKVSSSQLARYFAQTRADDVYTLRVTRNPGCFAAVHADGQRIRRSNVCLRTHRAIVHSGLLCFIFWIVRSFQRGLVQAFQERSTGTSDAEVFRSKGET